MRKTFFNGICILFVLLMSQAAQAQVEGVQLVFMEPDAASEKDRLPGYRLISDTDRLRTYTGWIKNAPASLALDLYKRAWRIAHKDDSLPVYHIAIIPGGNHADMGFRLRNASGTQNYPQTAFIKLAAEEWVFSTTLLHETGHIILSLLNGGRGIPSKNIASIPHTTSALTDRGTAFNEGFAIHLETLAAHLSTDPVVEERYHHATFPFGTPSQRRSEYYRQSMDLLTYAQTRTRYHEVRENTFAFAPAFRGPDYFRVQLEKSRDFATLRDANQLLQSEGFYATFFFSLLVRGTNKPTTEVIRERQDRMLAALAEMFQAQPIEANTPYLLRFAEAFMRKYSAEAGELADVIIDLSHGVFVDVQAAALWREHYLAALHLDLAERSNEKINKARSEWKARILANPNTLYANLGPQIRCEVPSITIRLLAFEKGALLSFDVNTADEGIIRMIPGITEFEVNNWLSQRAKAAFKDPEDFKKRIRLSETVLASLRF